jgi:hypothetical protein
MMRLALATAFVAVSSLSGCATSLTGANEAGGIVNSGFNMGQGKSMEMANKHCAKYGKVARVSGQNEIRNSITFDCVPRT